MKRAAKIIAAGIATFLLLFVAIGINTPNPGSSSHLQAPTSSESPAEPTSASVEQLVEPTTPEITTEAETKTISIPYETINRDDNTLARGTTKVVQEGSLGTREDVYTVTYTDGVETNRVLTSSKVLRLPVTRIINNGTYVAPQPQTICENGTYINSAGQTVCRPSSSNNGGATAICRDGTYSYSQSRRGTCSHHGGVRQWL